MKLAMRKALLGLGAIGVVALGACNASHEMPFDKNTNWLEHCVDSDACGVGLQCVCGMCTSVCDRNAQCSELDDDAVCTSLATSGSACDEGALPESVCSLACTSDDACADRNTQLECVAGECMPRREQAPASDAGEQDAGEQDAAVADDAEVFLPDPDAGMSPSPVIDPATIEQVADACASGATCEARVAAPGKVNSFFATEDGILYWTAFGSTDELGNHRGDGSVGSVAIQGGAAQAVLSDLERPFRVWRAGEQLFWLSGDPKDYAAGNGMQTLLKAPADGSADSTEVWVDAFSDLRVRAGEAFWMKRVMHETTAGEEVMRFHLVNGNFVWNEYWIEGDYTLSGLDDEHLYFENGGSSVMRGFLDGSPATEILVDPRVTSMTVADDALWVLHIDSDSNEWLASMSKDGREITHIAAADNFFGLPQAGESVVWTVSTDLGTADDGCAFTQCTWTLRAFPKSGGAVAEAFVFDTVGEDSQRAPGPVWIAVGDEVWVYAMDALVRVRLN